ncbi:MAG: hypothetical protein WBN35_11920 [Acidimicrobiia bacterium]
MPRVLVIASVVAVAAGAFSAAGCGGLSDETTSTTGSELVFGRGSLPETVPLSFPIPDEAVVGATLVDADRGLTELILTFPAGTAAVVDYYEENLPLRGYKITDSRGTETEWRLDFSDDVVDGVVSVQAGGSGVAAAAVQFTER